MLCLLLWILGIGCASGIQRYSANIGNRMLLQDHIICNVISWSPPESCALCWTGCLNVPTVNLCYSNICSLLSMILTTVGGWRHILGSSGTRFTFYQWNPMQQKLANAGAKALAFPCFVEFCWAYQCSYCSGACWELGAELRRERYCWQECNLNMLFDTYMLVLHAFHTLHSILHMLWKFRWCRYYIYIYPSFAVCHSMFFLGYLSPMHT